MPAPRLYQVKEVAELSGVSIRTLHHYDAIGLLVPRVRSAAGYRLYCDEDLLRLQQILIGRELDFSLEEIRRSLDDPAFDRRAALLAQRAALAERAGKTASMIRAIDAALATIDGRGSEDAAVSNKVDLKKIFDGFDHEQYADEAKQRWGGTDAYRLSEQRAKAYTQEDWERCRDEQGAIYAAAVAAMRAGKAPTDAEAMDIAERHRLAIDRWFYPCSPKMHAGLADMWETDKRFEQNIDKHGAPGLTRFLAAAVRANARRAL